MYDSPYKNSLQCAVTVVRKEGVRALYRSYTTQIAMNVPFQIVHFSLYEQVQNLLNYEREYKPMSHIVSGAVAGSVAALVTNPFDVCKTLLNTQETCCNSGRSVDRGLLEAARTVASCHGWGGFFRGAKARMIFQMPSAAISWSIYEFFKYFISEKYSASTPDHSSLELDMAECSKSSVSVSSVRAPLLPPVYANDKTLSPTSH